MTLREITMIEGERAIFRSVLTSPDGLLILAWLGNECGAWAMYPDQMRPDLIALWNRILHKCGIVHTKNLLGLAQALASAASDEDLMAERMKHADTSESDGTGRPPGGSTGDTTGAE